MPAGALGATVPITVSSIPEGTLQGALQRDFGAENLSLLGAVNIATGGNVTFSQPVQLSIPNSAGVSSDAQILVMQYLPNLNGAPSMSLVGIATVQGSQIVTSSSPFGSATQQTKAAAVRAAAGSPTGIVQPGQFALLQPKQAVAFSSGKVLTSAGAPAAGAVVSTLQAPQFVSQTNQNGSYVLAIFESLANVTIVAADAAFANFGILPYTLPNAPPLPPAPVPSNITLEPSLRAALIQDNMSQECEDLDDQAENALQQLLNGFISKLKEIAAEDGIDVMPVPPAQAPTTLAPNGSAQLELDFRSFFSALVTKAGGLGPEVNSEVKLEPFNLTASLSLANLQIGGATPAVLPSSDNQCVISNSNITTPTPMNGGLQAIFGVTASSDALSCSEGTANIVGSVPHTNLQAELTYGLDEEDEPSPCTGDGGQFTLDVAPNNGAISINPYPIMVSPITSLSITPPTPLQAGATEQLTATATYSNGSSEDVTSQVTWASSNDGFATIDAAGLATGVSIGSVTITASLDSLETSATLVVTPAFSFTVPSQLAAFVGVPYSHSFCSPVPPDGICGSDADPPTTNPTGGIGQYVFSMSGDEPGGMSLDSISGLLSGTAPAVNFSPYTFTVCATDQGGGEGAPSVCQSTQLSYLDSVTYRADLGVSITEAQTPTPGCTIQAFLNFSEVGIVTVSVDSPGPANVSATWQTTQSGALCSGIDYGGTYDCTGTMSSVTGPATLSMNCVGPLVTIPIALTCSGSLVDETGSCTGGGGIFGTFVHGTDSGSIGFVFPFTSLNEFCISPSCPSF